MANVYVQTNEPENKVLVLHAGRDGALTLGDAYATGGAGTAKPHLPSQGSVVLTGDGRHLLVANATSDDVTVFSVDGDGLRPSARAATGGVPRSVAEHAGLVYVLATADATVSGYRLQDGGLDPIEGSRRALSAPGADPAQVAFTPDGRALVVTERGTNSIVTFPVEADGTLGEIRVTPSSGATPYGFALTGEGTMVVTEAFGAQKGAAAASSYKVDGAAVAPVTASAGNGRSEICWAAVSRDGRYAFTTNFADGAVSAWAVAADGRLALEDAAAGITVDGRIGLRDLALTDDGRYLYAVDADSGSVFGWAVDGSSLSPLGAAGGLPVTSAGLAAR
jgi:6-phosphogluconolactonase